MNDDINHPKHYTSGSLEVIHVIRDSSTPEEYEGFLVNNVKKYIMRYKHKNGVQDLKKAKVYLSWLIEHYEAKEQK